MKTLRSFFTITLIVYCCTGILQAQTTLEAGHIAFIGWFSDGVDGSAPQYNDGFTFILLRDLSAGTVIYFTDNGWSDAGWVNSASEMHVSWTVPSGGLPTGTIVYIYESPTSFNTGIASTGTLSALLYGTTWHWASSGDQILAYQGSGARTSSPTFIAALDADYTTSFDLSNGWSSGTVGAGYEETFCSIPTGLTDATNCVALFNSSQSELWDNCKYNGTLTGSASTILSLINNYSNWTGSNSAPYDISASAFPTPAITDPLPVELTSFTASAKQNSVELKWNTATEKNNFGFEVERRVSENRSLQVNGSLAWGKIGFVEGAGNSNAPKSYSFVDASATGKVAYRLKQIDRDGKISYSQSVETEILQTPKTFALMQNYPNPFNPTTVINYQLPMNSHVTLKVYDAIGKEVATLVDEVKEAGSYDVQLSMNNYQLSSGIYFYRMTAHQTDAAPAGGQEGKFTAVKKLMLVK